MVIENPKLKTGQAVKITIYLRYPIDMAPNRFERMNLCELILINCQKFIKLLDDSFSLKLIS